jgi:hypothetical protein
MYRMVQELYVGAVYTYTVLLSFLDDVDF